jgi:hypothetical protein
MKRIAKYALLTFLAATFFVLPDSEALAMNGRGGKGGGPYGGYCPGPRRGWYGARKPVKTAEEAKQLVREFFGGSVVVENLQEREFFFEADVKSEKSVLIDIVIVDKRTGRIRSIY